MSGLPKGLTISKTRQTIVCHLSHPHRTLKYVLYKDGQISEDIFIFVPSSKQVLNRCTFPIPLKADKRKFCAFI